MVCLRGRAPYFVCEFDQVLANPVVASLMADGRLIATRPVPSDEPGRLLAHDTVWPRSYAHEWCAPMLKDAGALILDVAAALLQGMRPDVDGGGPGSPTA